MARIAEEELARLKTSVDLAALVRSRGVELKAHGSKDLAGLSPFTQEKTASLIVSPGKNLWHCMSSGQGGSVIDFVMKYDGVSFREAVELLREKSPQLYRSGAPVKKSTVPKLPPPVAFDVDDQTLIGQVLGYYRERLRLTPAALEYLQKRGISAEAIEHFGIGFADRTLGQRLPYRNRRDGAAIRERLIRIGLYRESGHEHFNGCVVFAARDAAGGVAELYGRRIIPRQSTGTCHLYLPGPHRGLFNREAFGSAEVILCESVIDALSFWCAGLRHVTCIWGTEGFTDDHLQAFGKHRTGKVYLAYDNDPAGNRAAQRDASRLMSLGIECFRVGFPAGMDANEYAQSVGPAERSLRLLLNASEWLGAGSRLSVGGSRNQESGRGGAKAGVSCDECADTSSLVAKELAAKSGSAGASGEPDPAGPVDDKEGATKDEMRKHGNGEARSHAEGEEHRVPLGRGDEQKKDDGVEVVETGDAVVLTIHERQYRIRGLEKNNSFEVMKINLRVLYPAPAANGQPTTANAGEARYHLDTFDLYRAKERESFIRSAAEETGLTPELLKRDLGKVLLQLEQLQEERLSAAEQPGGAHPDIPPAERGEALALLGDPRLLERILTDFEVCGVVGEATNKLTGYLAAVSRKLDRPLAVIVQSTSAAGKTALMESVLAFMPEEERIKYSAMTGQSLYYLGETNLKNKILAIVEEEGAEKASYALKLLQSEGELTIASTGKDPATGRMETQEYHVEGPVMIFLTTTAIDIDEELLNRCLVLTVDEGREQTKAIHRMQREAETFEGLRRKVERDRVLKIHRNAQRLLEPLAVVNPFAPRLTFLSDRTRTRRDHVKYLALIRALALLHQHQREVKEHEGLRYIEATLSDIEAANRLAHEVLGRSLDELPPQTRKLLIQIREMVASRCRAEGLDQDQCLFTRRQVRRFTGMTEFQVRTHLNKLQEMEYILPHHGGRGQSFVYELLFDGEDEARPQMCGLIDTVTMQTSGIEKPTPGKNGDGSSPQQAPNETGSRNPSPAAEASEQKACGPVEQKNRAKPENAQRAQNRRAFPQMAG